jgi:hypothetical protein
VTPPFTGHYTHTLRTEILALQQDFTSERAALLLKLRVELAAEAGMVPTAARGARAACAAELPVR